MNEKSDVVSLAALAQGMRLRIFRSLADSGPRGLTPGALFAILDVPAATQSFLLNELMHTAGCRRSGMAAT